MSTALALLGGSPVRSGGWPRWPEPDRRSEAALLAAFRSGRWTITSPGDGAAWERRFGAAFAAFCETAYAVPTASGSSALTVALAGVGVQAGTEVIIPAATWVACAASVLALGARPIPVDIQATDLGIAPEAVRQAITERTAAILVVHQNCCIADLQALGAVADESGIALVEDCSHAHGARLLGARVGTYGKVGAFSLQQNKLLACGEGGVVVTQDPAMFRRMQQLRANGREYVDGLPDSAELNEAGDEMGDNFVMSEFAAAIALAQLGNLEAQNAQRRGAALYLNRALSQIDGVRPVVSGRSGEEPAYHKYTIWVDTDLFEGVPVTTLARALTAEVGFPIGVLDAPLATNRLYQPHRSPRMGGQTLWPRPTATDFPISYAAAKSCLTIRHHALLADQEVLADLVAGLAKLQRGASALVGLPTGA